MACLGITDIYCIILLTFEINTKLCNLNFICAFQHNEARMYNTFSFLHFYRATHYSAKRGLAIACRPSVRPSVTLVDCDHIGWKTWKLIARTISPTPSLFVARRRSTHSQGNMGKFGGD